MLTEKTCSCPSKKRKSVQKSAYPILSSVLIALLPKCHFCILAYSSAITLCSGTKIYDHSPEWTSFISIGLAVLTLFFVLINYRGKRTIFSAIMVLIGSMLIIRTELYTGEIIEYYYGVGLLMIGVWVNASFYYFFFRFIKPLFNFLKFKKGKATLKNKG